MNMVFKSSLDKSPLKLNSRFIIILSMLFLTASLAADVVAYKFTGVSNIFILSGATIVFPITYTLGDIIAEVYGYAAARRLIWYGLFCELIFALLIEGVIRLPSSSTPFPYQNEYKDIFAPLLRFVISGIVADLVSNFINIYIISKWKIFMKGKKFWLRSIGSTAIAELVMNIIICFMAFTGIGTFLDVLKITLSAYALEMFYASIFVVPAALLAALLKNREKIDAFDFKTNYNPFRLD